MTEIIGNTRCKVDKYLNITALDFSKVNNKNSNKNGIGASVS